MEIENQYEATIPVIIIVGKKPLTNAKISG